MRRLLLLRHSKAIAYTGSADHQRPLTERGRADAAQLGSYILSEKIVPDAAIHSGAQRTKETLAIAAAKLRPRVEISVEPSLYEAGRATFLDVVRHGPDKAKTLLVVGHNPTIAEMASRLTGTGEPAAMIGLAGKFPTSALAVIDFDVDQWSEIDEGEGRLIAFATPASLGEREE